MSQTRRISWTQNKRRGVSPGAAAVSVVAAIAAILTGLIVMQSIKSHRPARGPDAAYAAGHLLGYAHNAA